MDYMAFIDLISDLMNYITLSLLLIFKVIESSA